VQEFITGQRWINDAELQLGLGTVLEVEHRTLTILFESIGETRTYAKQSAPLTRVAYSSGDTVRSSEGIEIIVETVSDDVGLLSYTGRDNQGNLHEIGEILLDHQIQLSRPSERLFSGQIDNNKWYTMRCQTLQELNRLGHSALRGLTGCRTSLIPHQLYIAHEVANRYAPRVLLADEVGLGKTIEAGLILHHQLLSERAQRVLIVVPENLVHQWLVEMLRRFNLHFSIFDEERYQSAIEFDPGQNPFESEQLVLCNLSFLTENPDVQRDALLGDWDLLVVDEAHHLQWTPQKASIDYQTVEALANVTKGVLLLTATPEQLGKAGHFARLRLLDPTRFPDFDAFQEEEKRYEPIANSIETLFSDDALSPSVLSSLIANIDDKENSELVLKLEQHKNDAQQLTQIKSELVEHLLDRHGTGRVLFRNTRAAVKGFPDRNLLSYPLAFPDAYKKLANASVAARSELTPELIYRASAKSTDEKWTSFDPRVEWLQNKLIELAPEKVLIITANPRTTLELAEALRVNYGAHLAVFHEGMSIIERDRAAAYFADNEEGSQALLCSEIGSEGRNFQFAHHMVLFDLPLNPDLLEQRIGRLDRIGQTQTINIHVPYLQDSAQAVMFDWLHQGLNAFEKSCPAGTTVFKEIETALLAALKDPESNVSELLRTTQNQLKILDDALHKGRDRLLEYNSCRPEKAEALQQQAFAEDSQSVLARHMDSIFDCFGVHTEEHSKDKYIISPGENMLTAFPHLQEDGMTITYDRNIALVNEDVHFLSWDHPMVTSAMDIVLTSELGNTSVIAIEHNAIEPGNMLLEATYIFESASSNELNTSRYLPPTTIRIVLDEQLNHYQNKVSLESIERNIVAVDKDTASKIVKAKLSELKILTQYCERQAQKQAPAILASAKKRSSALIKKEINRLKALSAVNQNVRLEEVNYFETQFSDLDMALSNANLRLDALRVIIGT
jgi:ATP-dependent helicase HepA